MKALTGSLGTLAHAYLVNGFGALASVISNSTHLLHRFIAELITHIWRRLVIARALLR
jgi:hypothetical protein